MIYRSEKGAPLTAQEVDDNFRQLDTRIKSLERHYPDRKVHEVKVEGDAIVIYDNAGVEMSRAQLPLLALNPRGPWHRDTAYARNDLVTYQGAAYVCVHTHKPGVFKEESWLKLMQNEVNHGQENSNN